MKTRLIILLALVSLNLSAQKIFDGMAVGASAGPTVFYGDLSEFDIIPVKPSNADIFGFAWNAFVQKDVYKGVGVKLSYENGYLTGGRLPGKQSVRVDFDTRYRTLALQVTYDLLDAFNKKEKLTTRTYLEAQVGAGMVNYRSVSYWSDSNRAREFVGYSEPESSVASTRKELLNESDMLSTISVPVGLHFGYRINYKTDIFFNGTLHNTFTDELDTWLRDWSAKDKYLYAGFGVRLNFNRDESEYPEKKDRSRSSRRDKDSASNGQDGGNGNSIFGRYKSQKNDGNNANAQNAGGDDTNMLNLQLQMFELQMKLFEMFYLEDK